MRLVEILQILAAFIGALASIVAAFEQKLIKIFKTRNATSANNSIELPKLKPLSRWHLSRLLNSGTIIKTKENTYFVNEESYRNLRRQRVKIALPATLGAIAIIILIHAFMK